MFDGIESLMTHDMKILENIEIEKATNGKCICGGSKTFLETIKSFRIKAEISTTTFFKNTNLFQLFFSDLIR